MTTVPKAWMPAAKMTRIIIHWSAGSHTVSALDRKHYHLIVSGAGEVVRGDRSIRDNQGPIRGSYAAHTRNCNTGSIGVSMACMRGAIERPFKAGPSPMTPEQWQVMLQVVADLARRYNIPVTPQTVLTHAEVQPTLGIAQRGKWDIARIAFDKSVVGHKACGDKLRREVVALLDDGALPPRHPVVDPGMKAAKYRVVGVAPSTLNFRATPGGEKKGALPEGSPVEKLSAEGEWWQVRTRGGYVGWVHSAYLEADDG